MKSSQSAVRDQFAAANQASAYAILYDPKRYGGEDAALVRWARLVAERHAASGTDGGTFDLSVRQMPEAKSATA